MATFKAKGGDGPAGPQDRDIIRFRPVLAFFFFHHVSFRDGLELSHVNVNRSRILFRLERGIVSAHKSRRGTLPKVILNDFPARRQIRLLKPNHFKRDQRRLVGHSELLLQARDEVVEDRSMIAVERPGQDEKIALPMGPAQFRLQKVHERLLDPLGDRRIERGEAALASQPPGLDSPE